MAIKKLDSSTKSKKLPTTYAILDNNRARVEKIAEILSLAGFAPCSRIKPSATTAGVFELRYRLTCKRYEFWQVYGIIKRSMTDKSPTKKRRRSHFAKGKRAYRARRAAAGLPRI